MPGDSHYQVQVWVPEGQGEGTCDVWEVYWWGTSKKTAQKEFKSALKKHQSVRLVVAVTVTEVDQIGM